MRSISGGRGTNNSLGGGRLLGSLWKFEPPFLLGLALCKSLSRLFEGKTFPAFGIRAFGANCNFDYEMILVQAKENVPSPQKPSLKAIIYLLRPPIGDMDYGRAAIMICVRVVVDRTREARKSFFIRCVPASYKGLSLGDRTFYPFPKEGV